MQRSFKMGNRQRRTKHRRWNYDEVVVPHPFGDDISPPVESQNIVKQQILPLRAFQIKSQKRDFNLFWFLKTSSWKSPSLLSKTYKLCGEGVFGWYISWVRIGWYKGIWINPNVLAIGSCNAVLMSPNFMQLQPLDIPYNYHQNVSSFNPEHNSTKLWPPNY